jgi:hypothetical protein
MMLDNNSDFPFLKKKRKKKKEKTQTSLISVLEYPYSRNKTHRISSDEP